MADQGFSLLAEKLIELLSAEWQANQFLVHKCLQQLTVFFWHKESPRAGYIFNESIEQVVSFKT